MFTAKNICFLSPSVCSRCWLPSTASNLEALLKEEKKYIAFLNSTPKNECLSDKSSVKGTDELSRTQWQSQLNRKVPVCHRRHSCCNVKFNLFNFNSSEVLFCTFSPSAQLWINVRVYMSLKICVWFYWFYITCLPTQRNFRSCTDLNVYCTERTVSSFRSYLRKSKYCEGDRRPIVVLDWTLNGVGTSWVEWGVSGPGHLTPGWEAQCTGNVTAGTDSAGIALSLKRTFCICPKYTLVWAHSCQGSFSSYPKNITWGNFPICEIPFCLAKCLPFLSNDGD